jgi:hypothetical protein
MTPTTDTHIEPLNTDNDNWEIPLNYTPADEYFLPEPPESSYEPSRAQSRAYRPRVLGQPTAEGGLLRTMSLDDLDSLPDPEWLVEGVLPSGVFTVLAGAPGSTKSFWALDVACSVASGYPLHGAEVKAGKVIVAVGEGLRGMKWRIEAWKLAHPEADLDALKRNLVILPETVRILDPEMATRLVSTCLHEAGDDGLRLFIIDTWARAMTGGDENSAQDTGLAIDVCETICSKTGATTLVVHHTGADGSRERGSTALRGAADAQLHMERDEKSGIVKMKCTKIKDGELFADQYFVLKSFGHSAILSPHQARFGEGLFQGGKVTKPQSPFLNDERPF